MSVGLLLLCLMVMVSICVWKHKLKMLVISPPHKLAKFNVPGKFFHEIPGNAHLDARYGKSKTQLDTHTELLALYHAFNKMVDDIDIHPMIMHGALIGYHFNNQLLPWDDDIDLIIVGDHEIKKLLTKDKWETNKYIFEINPNHTNRDTRDHNNRIDARMISKRCGLFIDFTFFWQDGEFLCAKDKHRYRRELILPMTYGTFHDMTVYLPNRYLECLVKEYGEKVKKLTFKQWKFDTILRKWVKSSQKPSFHF